MPVAPYTWQTDDYPTASRLNGELYTYNGMQFTANGTRWHAYRPVYASYQELSITGASDTWTPYQISPVLNSANTVADTAAIYGIPLDPHAEHAITQTGPAGGGGLATSPGGLYLMAGYIPVAASANGPYGHGLGPVAGGTPTSQGTFQAANSHFDGCAWTADILDIASLAPGQWAYQFGGFTTVCAGTDGSGEMPRLQALWSSVYPANGTTVASVPSPATSITTMTSTALNATIQQVMRLLNMPPAMRAVSSTTQSIANNTPSVVSLGFATYDTYAGFASGTTYTVPLAGQYLCIGVVAYTGITGECGAGISIGGVNYWGPATSGTGAGRITCAKVQVFDLHAGDTVQLTTYQLTGAASIIGSAGPSRLTLIRLCGSGAPGVTTADPDVTYRWTAGMTGTQVASALTSTLISDMAFLLNPPYLTAYATAAQTGIALTTNTHITSYNTVSGIIHGTSGDNYSGWSAGNQKYTAPVSGWYLACQETFMTIPGSHSSPAVTSLLMPAPAGALTWDRFQFQNMSVATNPGGSAGLGLYYLRAGDTLQSGVLYGDTVGTTVSTSSTAAGSASRRPHFEIVWVSE